jgi:hypothetical protein
MFSIKIVMYTLHLSKLPNKNYVTLIYFKAKSSKITDKIFIDIHFLEKFDNLLLIS